MGNSISHLTKSEEIILRERRFSDAEKKKKRKKASRKDKKGKNQGRKNRKQDRKRADGRSNKRQKIKKERKKIKNKKGQNKRKSKKSKKSKKSRKRKQKQSSCSSNEVSLTCMKNAMDCMLFEKNQILNWQKQAKRLENHGTISTNKVGKKGEFEEARKHLEWAIGGDKNNPQCGPNTTSGRLSATGIFGETIDFEKEQGYALANLTLMENCSTSIEAACNTSGLTGVNLTEFSSVLSTCRSMMTEFNDKSKVCRGLTDSISNQCKCWSDLSVSMANIKTFNCKRIKATQKMLTTHKNDCIKVFSKCKKSEDHSVEAVYSCMEDHSMGFINQSLVSLAEAAVDGSKVEQRFREFQFLSI